MKMKYLSVLVAGTVLLAACKESAQEAPKPLTLDNDDKKVSYAMGMSLGDRFRSDEIALDSEAFAAGLNAGLSDGERLLTAEEVPGIMQAFQQRQMEKMQKKIEEQSAAHKTEGEAYLAENAKKEGVVSTDSGLQYKVLTAGEGEKPSVDSIVKVHYKGTLIDGTEFDSSYSRGEPVEFPVGGVIAGWTEALQLMPAGSKWQLAIPADLAYGESGAGPQIGPNSTLLFDVELLEVKEAPKAEEGEQAHDGHDH
jgi:FKBP-type peptidyl-prolyl cis-trans isomerase